MLTPEQSGCDNSMPRTLAKGVIVSREYAIEVNGGLWLRYSERYGYWRFEWMEPARPLKTFELQRIVDGYEAVIRDLKGGKC